MSRGEAVCWMGLAVFGTGAVLPSVMGHEDDIAWTRLVSVPVALACAAALAAEYFF